MKIPLTWFFLALLLGQLSIYLRYDLQTYYLTSSTPKLFQHLIPLFLYYQSVQLCNGLLYILFPYALLTVFVFQFFTLPNRYVVMSYLFILIIFGIQAIYEYPTMDYFVVNKIPNFILQHLYSSKLPSTLSTAQQKQLQEFETITLEKLTTLCWLHVFEIFALLLLMYWQYRVEQSNVGFPLLEAVNNQFLPKIGPQDTPQVEEDKEMVDKEENPWRIRETEFVDESEEEEEEEEEEFQDDKKNQ